MQILCKSFQLILRACIVLRVYMLQAAKFLKERYVRKPPTFWDKFDPKHLTQLKQLILKVKMFRDQQHNSVTEGVRMPDHGSL